MRIYCVITMVCALAGVTDGQTVVNLRTHEDTVMLQGVLRAQDSRSRIPLDLTLPLATESSNASIRALAAQAIGRLEQTSGLSYLTPLLADPVASVRVAAADAVAQTATHGGGAEARAALRARFDVEKDPAVRAMLAESIARAGPFTAPELADAAQAIAPMLEDTVSLISLRGAVRSASFLVKAGGARAAIPPLLTDRMTALTTFGLAQATARRLTTAAMRDTARYVRMVAAATLFTRAPDAALVTRVADDPSPLVRDKAATALATLADTSVAHRLVRRMLQDSAPLVRFRVIAAFSRRFHADGCGPLGTAARDRDATVALAAIDALASCRDAATDALLDSLAGSLPPAANGDWHRAAHALVALPTTGARTARAHLDGFVGHPNPFVRTYAARAAAKLADTATLKRLATDAVPNVASAAVDGLVTTAGHAADSVYIAALETIDSQQLMSAAKGLQGTKDPRAEPALFAALDRLTALKRQTSRDGRVALLARIQELGNSSDADRLRSFFLVEFDSVVRQRASDAITAWTGVTPTPRTVTIPEGDGRFVPPLPLPTVEELSQLSRARVTIEMADGGTIELRLFPFDAPTNAERFARLARSGYFDGLTFHRVVAAFVVQGGSQHANEYFGDAAFTRDELGLENARGTIGVSTRGHDTGDGQLYFNLIDNLSLDHMYTVFAAVTSGMDVVDRLQEGAVIRRIVIH